MDEFSLSDIKCLDEILYKYKEMSSLELTEISHRDAAWIKADRLRKRDPEKDWISKLDIAQSGGTSKDILFYIKHEMQLDRELS